MDLIFHCVWLRNMMMWQYSIIHTEISLRMLTVILRNRSIERGLIYFFSFSLVFNKGCLLIGILLWRRRPEVLCFSHPIGLHCVKWDSSESERQRSETEGDGWREEGVYRVRSDFGNQPKVTLFIQSCQRCGDAPDRNNNTAIRPASAKHSRTLLDSDPLYLLIRRTFIDICRFPSCGIIARTRFSFPDLFGLGKPPRITQCWVWVGRCFSQNKWFPVALSCIIRSADNGLPLTVRPCGHGLWKPRIRIRDGVC